ncbi:MAG: hypothetical protein H5T97_00315 [Firmicutes bacterium]|nr:hypothetical protein [Bacillota bacterium]
MNLRANRLGNSLSAREDKKGIVSLMPNVDQFKVACLTHRALVANNFNLPTRWRIRPTTATNTLPLFHPADVRDSALSVPHTTTSRVRYSGRMGSYSGRVGNVQAGMNLATVAR